MPRLLLPALLALAASAHGEIVINEVHYNPPENPIRQEFVELHNSGSEAVDLSGWRLSGAVDFNFPGETVLPAGQYLVIAEDPPTLASTLRAEALGPYEGKLNSEGETIRLRNPLDVVLDEVDYRVGFPWPVGANGDGPSLELINPSLDNSLGSSWRSANAPSPGLRNSVFAANAAPNIRKVAHTPQQPSATDTVLITALVTDPDGVASVSLEYQLVHPGRYVPSHLPLPIQGNNINLNSGPRPENIRYRSGWIGIPMADDGTGGDALAGDGVYSATVPAHGHRTLVRYRIVIEDEPGLSIQVPYPDDQSLNFAYFIYNGIPAYEDQPVEALASVPVYHLLTRGEDYEECLAYSGTDQINQGTDARFFYNWSGTIVYDGVVYDNIRYRLRGANGRYHQRGKRSMRFRFNDGRYFQARDQDGRNYPKKWRTLTTGKGFDNRGTLTYGLNEAMSMHLFNAIGIPGPHTHWIHWRVIDNQAEAPDRWRGDFQGLYFVLETYDIRFMEGHDMEVGNLYKLINQTTDWRRQQRYQAADGALNGSDHNHIENQLNGSYSARQIREYVNVDRWNHWHALAEAMRIYDFWPSSNKNMVYYFEPFYTRGNSFNGRLWILPWDTDASWGPTWNQGHDVVYNAYFPSGSGGGDGNSTPELWPDYFNTVREVRDLLWQRDQISPLLTEVASPLLPLEEADALRWKGAPSDAGNYGGLSGAGAISVGHLVRDMNNFAFVGGNWPGGSVGQGGRAAHLDALQASQGEGSRIPVTPTISYTGEAGFPVDGLSLECSGFRDPQGDGSFGAMEWRVAEITDTRAPAYDPEEPFKLEWNADWESGELTSFDNAISIPATTVRPGRTYRARVRHKDNTGRWSHWSSPVKFTTTLPDISALRNGLVVSELMYHPGPVTSAEVAQGFDDDDFFEFIEIRNVGAVPLDLQNVRFTKGVDFDFSAGTITTLDPGSQVLVVSNREAFELRHGAGHPVAGEWDPNDKLDNGGEVLKLSFGAGEPIIEFEYDDMSPWPTQTDGHGPSLTLIDPGALPDHNLPSSWRASYQSGGTAGMEEASNAFDLWRSAQGVNSATAPYPGLPLPGLVAYGVGVDLAPTPAEALPKVVIVNEGGVDYPALEFRTRTEADELSYVVEVTAKVQTWESGPSFTVEVGIPRENGDGTITQTVRTMEPRESKGVQFLRLKVLLSP